VSGVTTSLSRDAAMPSVSQELKWHDQRIPA
jgi:hypothetical protein